MKTYNDYLQIIKDREYEEQRPARENNRAIHDDLVKDYPEHGKSIMCLCFSSLSTNSKPTFDYSVEIMGMMMRDFLEELKVTKAQSE